MIYLDYNATTPMDPRVREAMDPLLGTPLNPSSSHRGGQEARGILIEATRRLAEMLGVSSDELVFTSGATEGLNSLIQGMPPKGHWITSSVEHLALLVPIQRMEERGVEVSYLSPEEGRGTLTVSQVEAALRPETSLIALGAVNAETGVMTDLEAIGRLAKARGIPFVVDGAAWMGKAGVRIPEGVSAFCFCGHKIYGPQGVGCVVVRKGLKLAPLIVGGTQQRGRRGGTENVPGIVGLARAVELFSEEERARIARLRDRLEAAFPDAVVHGMGESRVCNTSNLSLPGGDGETLVMQLDLAGIAISQGSACASGVVEASRVLRNMGVPKEIARASVRISLGRWTTREEIDQFIQQVSSLRHSLPQAASFPSP